MITKYGQNIAVVGGKRAKFLPVPISIPELDIDSFSPLLWLDAQDYATISESSGPVSSWSDKSGNSNDAAAVLSPEYQATGFPGGLPCVSFSGDSMSLPVLSASVNSYVAFIVFDSSFPEAFGPILDSESGRFILGVDKAAGKYGFHNGAWRLSTSDFITGEQMVSYHAAASPDGEIFLNATSVGTPSGYTDVAIAGDISIGSKFDGNSSFRWTGLLAEMIILPGNISQSDRELFEGYLAHKWELEGDLPPAHPHKSTPPILI